MCKYASSGLVAFALFACHVAHAADLPHYPAPAPAPLLAPAAPGFTWTGFYVGGQAGYAWGRDRTSEYVTGSGAFTGFAVKYNVNGALGGIHGGGNYQFGAIVLGAEADLEAAQLRGGFVDPTNAATADPGGAARVSIGTQGSVRGRVGYALDRTMVYGTGGLALADIRYSFVNLTTRVTENTQKLRSGYTFGGGIDYAITNNLIGGVEYRYSEFSKFTYNSTASFPGLNGRQLPRSNTLRVRLGYKF